MSPRTLRVLRLVDTEFFTKAQHNVHQRNGQHLPSLSFCIHPPPHTCCSDNLPTTDSSANRRCHDKPGSLSGQVSWYLGRLGLGRLGRLSLPLPHCSCPPCSCPLCSCPPFLLPFRVSGLSLTGLSNPFCPFQPSFSNISAARCPSRLPLGMSSGKWRFVFQTPCSKSAQICKTNGTGPPT